MPAQEYILRREAKIPVESLILLKHHSSYQLKRRTPKNGGLGVVQNHELGVSNVHAFTATCKVTKHDPKKTI